MDPTPAWPLAQGLRESSGIAKACPSSAPSVPVSGLSYCCPPGLASLLDSPRQLLDRAFTSSFLESGLGLSPSASLDPATETFFTSVA